MSWSIGNLVNSVKLNKACKIQLMRSSDFFNTVIDYFCSTSTFEDWIAQTDAQLLKVWKETFTNNYLPFTEDWCEHMDYVTYSDEIRNIIAANGCEGDVCFGSLEGDNAGEFWGIRFTNGTSITLKGQLQFVPDTGE